MSHTDPEILALRALGETAGTARDAEHAQTCPRCRAELARLTEVVQLARGEGAGERLQAPRPQVWDRIAAAVGADPVPVSPAAAAANGSSAPAVPRIRPRRGLRPGRRRRRLATGLAGLAAGLIIGIAGTAGIVQLTQAPATRVVAEIALSPLPQFPQWQDATGKQIKVSNFVISVHQGVLTAEVNGNPKVRVPLLRLSLAHATIHAGRHYVRISGIVLTLTKAAASALDTTFGTTLFTPGLKLGTASTVLRF